MRTPRWLRGFFDWRWAPCVALIGSALLFVALALLLIPAQFAGAPRAGDTPFGSERPSLQPERAPFGASLPGERTHASESGPSARRPESSEAPRPEPLPTQAAEPARAALPAPEPAAAAQPDFGANLADRGDRPERPARPRR